MKPEIKKTLKVTPAGIEINIFVLPRSSRCEIGGIHNNALKVKLTSPPVDNAANDQCCKFMAKHLGVPKRKVSIIKGRNSRYKTLRIEDITEQEIVKKILLASDGV